MTLSEIGTEQNLIIEVIANEQHFEFNTKSIYSAPEYVYAEPIRNEGRVVSFKSDMVKLNLIMTREGKPPVVWRQVHIETTVYKDATVYEILAPLPGKEENRRSAFRVPLNLSGVVQVGQNRKAIDTVVRDISEGGFAFISKEKYEDPKGKLAHLMFADGSQKFSLTGIIMRSEPYEDYYIYGCMLNQRLSALSKYVTDKQRAMIAKLKNETVEESAVAVKPHGFGDLRKENKEDSRKDSSKLMELSQGANPKWKNSNRYSRESLVESDRKKINTDRYKELHL